MIAPDFVLSAREFDIVWDGLDLGPKPYPLDVPSVGRTAAERAEAAEEVYRDLAERGLVTGRGLDERLAGQLRLLARPDVSVDAVGHIGVPLRAVAARDGHGGVLAAFGEDELWLVGIRPTALAGSIVAVLPENQAGPGRAMSVPYQAMAAAVKPTTDDDPFTFASTDDDHERITMVRAGLSTRDAAELAELADHRHAGGQFGVSRRQRRSPVVVTWFDTPRGRYLGVRDGDWVSFAPADNDRLTARIDLTLNEVTP
ncbi:ESX secretion-associated protein EspG [Saccharothrix sp. NRRL B-16348]|uniref:ESX secretion-associated protein EspG n=1 Tax=Saccharothrix sp. NRRL B-16348 TaxID=1415542 RepID=UPI0006AE8C7E|nr:ESX secretion-associated protein EspG [Saccharothrix sp. NRRL B-16348]